MNNLEIVNGDDLRKFIKLPWYIYRNYPKWVPPLVAEMRRKLDPKRNPVFDYAQVKLFGVCDENRQMIGRIAVIFNPIHCEIHHEFVGFFGLFECINSIGVAERLISLASGYLRKFKCTHMIGPVNFTTNEESGLLVQGYQESPMLMCNYSPPYYADLLTACGAQKTMDLLSYRGEIDHVFPPKYARVIERVSSNNAVTVVALNRHNMSEKMPTLQEIFNSSFRDVWGFVPLSLPEMEAMGRSMAFFLEDELSWIAEYKKEAVGFILALPDMYEVLKDLGGHLFPFGIFKLLIKRRHIKGVRVIVLCVLPKYRSLGIETLLIYKVRSRMITAGYERAELSVINENNMKMRNVLERLGFKPIKRYRIYRVPISEHLDEEK